MRIGHFALAVMLACGHAQAQRSHPSGGTPIPAAALAVGYTSHTFSTVAFSTSNVDIGSTYAPGFEWYLWNFFGGSASSSGVSFDSGVASLFELGAQGQLSSIGQISNSPKYVGTAFGCGAYMTAEIAFDPSSVNMGVGWPAWWTMAAEHLVYLGTQWSGQAAGYDHFIELDTFEFDRRQEVTPYAYGFTLHDWYGVYNSTCPAYCVVDSPFNQGTTYTPNKTDFTLFHRIAALWVPATSGSSGYVKSYFDDVQVGSDFSWSQFTNQSPPPSSPWTFGVIDTQHLALILASGSGVMRVKSVDVWQPSSACNIAN